MAPVKLLPSHTASGNIIWLFVSPNPGVLVSYHSANHLRLPRDTDTASPLGIVLNLLVRTCAQLACSGAYYHMRTKMDILRVWSRILRMLHQNMFTH